MSRELSFLKPYVTAFALGLGMVFFAAEPALAQQTLGKMTNRLYESILNLQTFLSFLSYILGIYFSITGMIKLRQHVDDPDRNPLYSVVLRLSAAAFFIFTPTLANMLVVSLGGGGVGEASLLTFSSGAGGKGDTSGGGLEVMLNRLVSDIAGPLLDNLIPFISYSAGVVFMLIGLKRLALASGDGPQAPGGMGTMGTFFIAAALMSFGYIVYMLEGSLFGTTNITNSPGFVGDAGEITKHANNAMWGVFIFLRIVGYISMLRALFMMRAKAEGGNIEMMSIATHLIAGALLANGTGFVLAIQNTFIDPANHILN